MKLRKQDQEFRNPRIFYPDPKNVDLDRVLIVLFLWLKTGGMRPATTGRQKKEFEKVDVHLKRLASLPGVAGFTDNGEIAQQWLETEGVSDTHPSGEKIAPYAPLCRGQSRVLCDDIERILSYTDVPRPVMIDYVRTILGLHLGIYTLRLRRQLAGWIRDCGSHPTCKSCPVYGNKAEPFAECPYPVIPIRLIPAQSCGT